MIISPHPLILLELRFKTILPINNLPFYHGAHWSALFRNILKPYLPNKTMSEAGVWVHPIETGILNYAQDDEIHLGLTFPLEHIDPISSLLHNFNNLHANQGHFQPGKTIILENVLCRLTHSTWNPQTPVHLSHAHIEKEIELLSTLNDFSILFYSPCRVPRPKGFKTENHHFCDEDFFAPENNEDPSLPLTHLAERIRGIQTTFTKPVPSIHSASLTWLDVGYGNDVVKTIGGIAGKLFIKGKPDNELASALVIGQYTGAGKNPTFGFGFYTIPETDFAKRVMQFSRGTTFFDRAFSRISLKDGLTKLPNSSPGIDGITLDDIKKAGDEYLLTLKDHIASGSYKHGKLKKYKLPKDDATYREIHVQNLIDRLVHRVTADCITPAVDKLLLNSSYAYRKGLNRKGAGISLKKALADGYTTGIKADITAFFDSVNFFLLSALLEGIFPFEPLIKNLSAWLKELEQSGVKGLLQGSPLSPVLSNLYLTRFDRDMEKDGFKLIRYADDFVLLIKSSDSAEELIKKVELSLAKIGLCLKAEKTEEIKDGKAVHFLGLAVTKDYITDAEKEGAGDSDKAWLPVFKEDWINGLPVYLTCICRGAYSSGAFLVIKGENQEEEKIPWNRISRIVIAGRSPFSGGVVYRAVKEEISATFIDVMGRLKGQLYPDFNEMPEILSLQHTYSKDGSFRLAVSKEIISAKVHNSSIILKRNSIDTHDLRQFIQKIKDAADIDTLRGYEGSAAKLYFSHLANIVSPFKFKGRVYHPPDCPVNVMLSLGYTLIYNRLVSVLKDKGFNTRLGFYHAGRGAHSSLASDLMEELRHIAERVTLTMIHRKEISPDDFKISQGHGQNVCRLAGEGFRKYILRFEAVMSSMASYYGQGKISYNDYLDEMADNFKRAMKLNISYKALRIE